MLTASFYIEDPKEIFCEKFENWMDTRCMAFPANEPKENIKKFIEDQWTKYGNDVLNSLAEDFGEGVKSEDEMTFTKTVIGHYIEWCYENPWIQITVEQYWKERLFKAMSANEEKFIKSLVESFTF